MIFGSASWVKFRFLAVIGAVTILGYIVTRSLAAGPLAAFEPEAGNVSSNVSTHSHGDASGNSLIRFGTTPQPYNPTSDASIPSNLQLAFQDEFSGTSLDLTKWDPNWLAWDATKITQPVNTSTEPVCYDPQQVTVGDGLLNLDLEKRPCTAANGVTYTHAGGMIQSIRYFNYTYGYAEAYINLPPGTTGQTPTNWAAFWTDGQNWPADGEDDIMETLSGSVCFTYHYSGGQLGSTCPALTAGWHRFASYWQPGSVTYFYDGIKVGTYNVNISSPHYLILNLSLANWGTANSVPANMQVDYVRVWQ